MTACPKCNTDNNRFLYVFKTMSGGQTYCSNCQTPLYLHELKKTVWVAIGAGLVSTILMYQFYYTDSNSSISTIILSTVSAFVITFVLDLLKLKFSLTKRTVESTLTVEAKKDKPKAKFIKSKKVESKEESTDDQLLAIYSKRNSQELEQMITNELIGMEAKKLVRQILKERIEE